MSKLTDFLINNPIDELTEEVMISDRFKDGDKILKFKIKAVSPNEFSELQKNCTKVGKKGKVNFDSKLFNEELIVNYTIEPNFKDSDAIKKAGCMTPAQFLNKVLLAGEVQGLVEKISELSGFDKDMDDLREEAKN